MTSLEDVDPADEPRALRSKPGWQRVIVLAAGSVMHFVLAAVLLCGLFLGVGLANTNTTKIGAVEGCVPASQSATSCARPIAGRRPAGRAETGRQDRRVRGHARAFLERSGRGDPRAPVGSEAVVIVGDGELANVHASLAAIKGRPGAFLGISPAIVYQHLSPIQAIKSTGSVVGTVVTGSADGDYRTAQGDTELFAHNRASTAGGQVTSIVGCR